MLKKHVDISFYIQLWFQTLFVCCDRYLKKKQMSIFKTGQIIINTNHTFCPQEKC